MPGSVPHRDGCSRQRRRSRRSLAPVHGRRSRGGNSELSCRSTDHRQSLGSFNLYGRARSAFDTLDAEILELLTTTVSRTLGDFARFKSARDVADSIQRALQTRAPIEQAKGILMALHGVDADEAFDLLRRESQATNTRLHTVATELVTRLSAPATDDSPTTEIRPDCSH